MVDESFEDPLDSEFESDDPLEHEDLIVHGSLDDDDDNDKFDIEDSLIRYHRLSF